MKRARYHSYFTFICCSLIFISCMTKPYMAHATSLLLFSPTRISLNQETPAATLKVKNLSDDKLHYKIHLHDYVMDETGYTMPVDHFPYSAKRHVRFAPRILTLEPGERQIIRVMLRKKNKLTDGAYHTHMFFEEVASETEDENAKKDDIQYVAALPIIINYGDVATNVRISKAKLSLDEDTQQQQLSLSLTREGNGQGYAVIENAYINKTGQKTAISADIKRHLYREIDVLNTRFLFTPPSDIQFEKGGHIRLRLFDEAWGKSRPILQEFIIPID